MLKPGLSLQALVVFLSVAHLSFADTVTLKSGETVKGRIVNETDAEVTVEVQVTASIKDEQVIKKADIAKIDRPQPDLEAWALLKNLALGDESLESADYTRATGLLNNFVTQFPQSPHAAEAKQKLTQFAEEAKRVDGGEVKLDGRWLTPEEVKEESAQINGRVLFSRMKRHAAAGQLVEAMNVFANLEKSAGGTTSYPDAVLLARQILPTLKSAAEQGKVRLKAQADERKRRLDNVQGADRVQLTAMQKQEIARTEAAVAAYEKQGLKWMPLAPATERSLNSLSNKASGDLTTLSRLDVEKMRASIASAERAKAALAEGNLEDTTKALDEARSAWAQNEMIARLQPKLAEAKTKLMEEEKAAKAKAAAEAAAMDAPGSVPPPSTGITAAPAPAAPAEPVVETQEVREEGNVLGKFAFWVVLGVILGIAFAVKQLIRKSRKPDENVLDQ